MTDTTLPNVEIVYVGRIMTRDEKIAYGFIPRSEIDTNAPDLVLRQASLYTLKARDASRFVVGCIYNMPAAAENGQLQRILFTYSDAIGRVDGELLALLSANDQATALQDRARVQFDKLKASNPLADEMQQLRRLYVNTAPAQRLALEMAVLRALRSPL